MFAQVQSSLMTFIIHSLFLSSGWREPLEKTGPVREQYPNVDTKSEIELPHGAVLNAEDKSTREKILTRVWTSYVKNEFEFDPLDPDKSRILMRHGGLGQNWRLDLMDVELKVEARLEGRLAASIWIYAKAVTCNGQKIQGRVQEPEKEFDYGSPELGYV